MAVKLRLTRAGAHKRPYYWLVAADTRMPRDGRFLEKLGTYNPRTKPSTVEVKTDRVNYWLDRGARPSQAVREILKGQGLLKAGTGADPAAAGEEAPRSVNG